MFVERGFDCRDGRGVDPGAEREEDGRRVAGVDTDEILGDIDGRGSRLREMVPDSEPGPTLADRYGANRSWLSRRG